MEMTPIFMPTDWSVLASQMNGNAGGEVFCEFGDGGIMSGEHSPHNCILLSNQEAWRIIMILNGRSDDYLGD